MLSVCDDLPLMANLVYQRLVKDTSTAVMELKEGTPLQSAALLLKCFKILENATFLSDDNKVFFPNPVCLFRFCLAPSLHFFNVLLCNNSVTIFAANFYYFLYKVF